MEKTLVSGVPKCILELLIESGWLPYCIGIIVSVFYAFYKYVTAECTKRVTIVKESDLMTEPKTYTLNEALVLLRKGAVMSPVTRPGIELRVIVCDGERGSAREFTNKTSSLNWSEEEFRRHELYSGSWVMVEPPPAEEVPSDFDFLTADRLMQEGKKVRCLDWNEDEIKLWGYLTRSSSNDQYEDKDGDHHIIIGRELRGRWELYKEPEPPKPEPESPEQPRHTASGLVEAGGPNDGRLRWNSPATFDFFKAVELAEQGHKVRSVDWYKDGWVEWVKTGEDSGEWRDESGKEYSVWPKDMRGQWELWTEPTVKTYTRDEARQLLLDGYRVRNTEWEDETWIESPDGKRIVDEAGNTCPSWEEFMWGCDLDQEEFVIVSGPHYENLTLDRLLEILKDRGVLFELRWTGNDGGWDVWVPDNNWDNVATGFDPTPKEAVIKALKLTDEKTDG